MKDLRTLLIDCRIELRKLVRDFHKTELCERLDVAMQTLAAAAPVELDAKNPPVASVARDIKETSNQVALAWQMAARDLKFTNPAQYDAMSKKVMSRLETKTLVDQVDELKQLEESITELKKQQVEFDKAKKTVEQERDALIGALATAVPSLADGGDRLGVALARIDWLKANGAKPTSGGARVMEEENPVPSAELMTLVAAGGRQFSKAQREWCVGEAMVLSSFQFTPMELIEQGDSAIAKIIIDAGQRKFS